MTTELALPALRGDTVLGFLAAVGVARTLTDELTDMSAAVGWPDGPYSGAVLTSDCADLDDLVDRLTSVLDTMRATERLLPGVDGFPPRGAESSVDPTSRFGVGEGRGLAVGAQVNPDLDRWSHAVVGFVTPIDRRKRDVGPLAKNQFLRAGPGTVWVPRTLTGIIEATDRDRIDEAIRGWRRVDGFLGAYLDHRADIDAATGQTSRVPPKRGVPGATFLAIMALPLFPVRSPDQFTADTVGWVSERGTRKGFTWPVWSEPMDIAAIRAVVDHRDVARARSIDAYRGQRLRALGIEAVFHSERIAAGNNNAAMATTQLLWERGV